MTDQNLFLMTSHGPGPAISQDLAAQQHSRMEHHGNIFHYQAQTSWIGKWQHMRKTSPRMGILRDPQKVLILTHMYNRNPICFLLLVSSYLMSALLITYYWFCLRCRILHILIGSYQWSIKGQMHRCRWCHSKFAGIKQTRVYFINFVVVFSFKLFLINLQGVQHYAVMTVTHQSRIHLPWCLVHGHLWCQAVRQWCQSHKGAMHPSLIWLMVMRVNLTSPV